MPWSSPCIRVISHKTGFILIWKQYLRVTIYFENFPLLQVTTQGSSPISLALCSSTPLEVLKALYYALESTFRLTVLNNICRLISPKFTSPAPVAYLDSKSLKPNFCYLPVNLFLSWIIAMVSKMVSLNPTLDTLQSALNPAVILPKHKSYHTDPLLEVHLRLPISISV